jgi:hypothetical protein
MTEHARQQSGGRTASGGGMTWKSGLLGASLGVVVLGWGLLARDSAADNTAPAPLQPQIIVVRVPVQSWPDSGQAVVASQSLAQQQPAAVDIAPLPQKPVFQQPITRTRSS